MNIPLGQEYSITGWGVKNKTKKQLTSGQNEHRKSKCKSSDVSVVLPVLQCSTFNLRETGYCLRIVLNTLATLEFARSLFFFFFKQAK